MKKILFGKQFRIFQSVCFTIRLFINKVLFLDPFITTRNQFPYVLNRYKLFGEGCEVGVKEGTYSNYLLSIWKGKRLYSIDPWQGVTDCKIYKDVDQESHDFFEKTKTKLTIFGNRSKIIRKSSQEAVRDFNDESLDFVYIDARHNYQSVKKDIEIWYPKVKKRGFLGGHDYCDDILPSGVCGVQSALDEFVKKHNHRLIITLEFSSRGRSWFIFKDR